MTTSPQLLGRGIEQDIVHWYRGKVQFIVDMRPHAGLARGSETNAPASTQHPEARRANHAWPSGSKRA
jgi:hypothetical protein